MGIVAMITIIGVVIIISTRRRRITCRSRIWTRGRNSRGSRGL